MFMREIYLLEITYSGQIKQISLETMNLCRAIWLYAHIAHFHHVT